MKTSEVLFTRINEDNQKHLQELKQKLKDTGGDIDNSWMMCLGAGVSISVGLPNWYGLLAKITAQLLPMPGADMTGETSYHKDVEQFYQNLTYDEVFLDKMTDALNGKYKSTFESINLLEAAEYIINFLSNSLKNPEEDEKNNDENLKKRVNVYMNFLIEQACHVNIEINPTNMKIQNSTLAAVARLMKSENDDLIHNVITYNYDNLLETYLREICNCNPDKVHSIEKKDKMRDLGDQEDWNIYHIHGRIPVIPYPGEDMSENVILTESDYYREETINYSWVNILQSYAMLRANLIFIGFSGTDYNFRRIIKYMNRENTTLKARYIFFSVDDIVYAVFAKELQKNEENEENKRKDIEDYVREMNKLNSQYSFEKLFINYLINSQTIYWGHYGLKVIWSSHEQLYEDLEQLH